MKRLAILLVVFAVMTACSSRKVNFDYDRQADFSKYQTYAWHEVDTSLKDEDPLAHSRVMSAVDRELSAKGFRRADSNPDVYVTYHGENDERMTLRTTSMGYGYGSDFYWGGGGMGSSTTQVHTYQVGTLVVDLWDAQAKELVWRGVVSDTISDNPQQNETKIDKAAEEMFKRYPPS